MMQNKRSKKQMKSNVISSSSVKRSSCQQEPGTGALTAD